MGEESTLAGRSHLHNRIHTINSGFPETFSAYPKPLLFSALQPSNIHLVDLLDNQKDVALYIHIPYCIKKCSFCFIDIVESQDQDVFSRYTDLLIEEISFYKNKYPSKPIQSVYIGGGTPIVLGIENLGKIVQSIQSFFNLHKNVIWEIDATPTILTDSILLGLKNLGIDTLNIGIQSTEKEVLKNIGREWQSNAYIDIIGKKIQTYGFRVHLDFIIGLPGENISTFATQLDHLCDVFHPASFSVNLYEETVYSPDFFSDRKDIYPKHTFLPKIAYLLEVHLKKKYDLGREHTDYIEGFHRRGQSVLGFGAGAFGYIAGKGMYKNPSILEYRGSDFQRYYFPMTSYDHKLMFLINNASREWVSIVYARLFSSYVREDFPEMILSHHIRYGENEKEFCFVFSDRNEMQRFFIPYYSTNMLSLYAQLVDKKLDDLTQSFNTYYSPSIS